MALSARVESIGVNMHITYFSNSGLVGRGGGEHGPEDEGEEARARRQNVDHPGLCVGQRQLNNKDD